MTSALHHRLLALLALALALTMLMTSPTAASPAGSPAIGAPGVVGRSGLAAPIAPPSAAPAAPAAPPATFDCATLWAGGFPREGTGLTYCLEHSNERIGGADYRVLYPSEWTTDPSGGWGRGYLDLATQALRDSVAVYGALGLMGSVTVVFSPLPGPPTSAADANLVEYLSSEPCAVVLYPSAGGYPDAQFPQVVAHELFHCFQYFNFQPEGGVLSITELWWMDGSADYFSNVVYPAANAEWEHIAEFDANSEERPITQFTYAASFFFQYLGNTIGNAEILKLLDSLPTAGDEAAQQAALREYPGMDRLFQGFAQQYLDKQVMDASGVPIPFEPTFTHTTHINASGAFEAKIAPFTIRRRQVLFDGDLTYTLLIERTGGPSLHAFRNDSRDWGEAPAIVTCSDPRAWRAAYTSVGDAGLASAPAVVTATVTASEGNCDAAATAPDTCLLGTWGVADYDAFMRAALAAAGATDGAAPITFEGSAGTLAFTFDASTITYTASAFELRGSTIVQGMAVSVTVRLEGTATAGYDITTPGQIDLIEVDATGLSVSAEIFVAGASMGVTAIDPLDWIFFLSPTYGYACSDARLDLTIPPLAEPVVLGRTG